MPILPALAVQFQGLFPSSDHGQERARWFILTLQAILLPITASRTSNLRRTIATLFGVLIGEAKFYTFMASVKLPWARVWALLWRAIPDPLTDGRLLEVLSPKGFGRVRMQCVPDASGTSLVPFVCDVVEPGTTVWTDGWGGYNDLASHGFLHHRTVVSKSGDSAHVLLPGVHRVAALLKRWLLGTHQGAVESDHLQGYLDEFALRFNRRRSSSRGLLFRRLLEQAVQTDPITYRSLVANPAPKPTTPQPLPAHQVNPPSLAGTSPPTHPWRDHNR